MHAVQSTHSTHSIQYIPPELWGLILSHLDPDEKAIASTVCKVFKEEIYDSLYSNKHLTLHDSHESSFPDANSFAQHIANKVLLQEVDPWQLYEKRVSVGGLDLIITKIRGHILLPYIYSAVFMLAQELSSVHSTDYTLFQIYFDTESLRFQHVKVARNTEQHINVPMMMFYTAYRILSTLYKEETISSEPMDIFSYQNNRFSKSCVFLENIPIWFDKLMSFQSRYHGKIIKNMMCNTIAL